MTLESDGHSLKTDMSPDSILHKSIAGRYRPVRVSDGPIMARYRFVKNVSWVKFSGPDQLVSAN